MHSYTLYPLKETYEVTVLRNTHRINLKKVLEGPYDGIHANIRIAAAILTEAKYFSIAS
jgi:hypothetical protein